MSRFAHLGIMAAIGLTAACAAAPASAQARSIVTPAIGIGFLYDNNILSQPEAHSDHILRIAPSLAIDRATPRSTWVADFAVDSEWFSRHTDLSTLLARQHAASDATWRISPRGTMRLNGAYDNSVDPADVNLATGLTFGRLRVWRGHATPEYEFALTPRLRAMARYRFTHEGAVDVGRTYIHTGELETRYAVTPRQELRLRYGIERYDFRDLPGVLSHRAMVGIERRLSGSTRIVLDGGVRIAEGDIHPELDLLLARRLTMVEASANYTWTRTSSTGVAGLVEVHRGLASVRYERPEDVAAAVMAGVYRNLLGDQHTNVYRVSADVLKRIFGPVSLAGAISLDRQSDSTGRRSHRAVGVFRVVLSGDIRTAAGPGVPIVEPQRPQDRRPPNAN